MILKNASHLPSFLVDFWAGKKFIHPLQFMLSKNKVQGFPFKAYRKNLIIKKDRKNFVWCTMHKFELSLPQVSNINIQWDCILLFLRAAKKTQKQKKSFGLKENWSAFLNYVFPLYCTCNVSQNQSWNFTRYCLNANFGENICLFLDCYCHAFN